MQFDRGITCEEAERFAFGAPPGSGDAGHAAASAAEAHFAACDHCRRDRDEALKLPPRPAGRAESTAGEGGRASDALFVNSVMARVRAEPFPGMRGISAVRWRRIAALWLLSLLGGAAWAWVASNPAQELDREGVAGVTEIAERDDWFRLRVPAAPNGADEFGFLRDREIEVIAGSAASEVDRSGAALEASLPAFGGTRRGNEGVSF